jgi:hypothetical protein
MEAEGAENPNLPAPNIPPQQNNNFTVPAIPLPQNQISFYDFVKKKTTKRRMPNSTLALLPTLHLHKRTQDKLTN